MNIFINISFLFFFRLCGTKIFGIGSKVSCYLSCFHRSGSTFRIAMKKTKMSSCSQTSCSWMTWTRRWWQESDFDKYAYKKVSTLICCIIFHQAIHTDYFQMAISWKRGRVRGYNLSAKCCQANYDRLCKLSGICTYVGL